MLANPRNFRRHPGHQREALKGAIGQIGYVEPVIVQAGTDTVIDGHLRVELALAENQPTIPVLYVDLSDAEADLALATLDPIAALAYTDKAQLDALLQEVDTDDAGLAAMLLDLAKTEGIAVDDALAEAEEGPKYSTKAETPIYEPTGEEPPLAALIDTRRHDQLAASIEASSVPEEVRRFLLAAATRHIVFDYRKIAEFYAHADAETQALMEESALVIIDLERAIELGYAKLRADLIDARAEALENAEEEENLDDL